MEGIIKRIKVTEEESILCQRYYFEMTSYQNLLKQFYSDSTFKPDQEAIDGLFQKYQEKYVQYNIYWGKLMNKYVDQNEYRESDIKLSFDECEIQIMGQIEKEIIDKKIIDDEDVKKLEEINKLNNIDLLNSFGITLLEKYFPNYIGKDYMWNCNFESKEMIIEKNK